jgi:hypothetical protein
MKKEELRAFVDNHEVWEGEVGSDAATLEGPVGIRSDNAPLEFDFMVRESEGAHPNYVTACKTGTAEE